MNKAKRKPMLICGILSVILIFVVFIFFTRSKDTNNFDALARNGMPMPDDVLRREMEESRWYDGMKFEGEISGNNLITYKELKEQVEKEGKRTGIMLDIGGDAICGGKWLKFIDDKCKDINGNPRVFFVAEKPITSNVSWNDLFEAGVVYGPDKINSDGTVKTDATEIDSNYKGKIIKIKNSKYMVRLMRGVSNNSDNLMRKTESKDYAQLDAMGSEWNRSIVPMVWENRGSDDFLEEDLKWANRKITSVYNWFGELTLGASESYDSGGYIEDSVGFKGQYSWCQENYNKSSHFVRGGSLRDEGAAGVTYKNSDEKDDSLGWRPVLEFIGGKPFVDNKFDY